jgi:regulator of sigma E protease
MAILILIVGLVLFIGLVVVHEWGHFAVARRGGIEAEEFSIFFPPRIFSKKMKAGWRFSIGTVPLGGYVKLKGEHDSDTEPGSFGAASTWVKTKVMAAGVVMNLIVGFVLFSILALIGMPRLVPHQFTVASDTKVSSDTVYVGYIEPGSPAAKAGLQSTDKLIGYKLPDSSAVIPLKQAANLPTVTKKYAGQALTFVLARQGKDIHKTVTLRSDAAVAASLKTDNPKGHLGVDPTELVLRRSTWSAPVVGAGLMWQLTSLTFEALGHVFGGLGSIFAGAVTNNHVARSHGQSEAANQLGGPIAIFFVLKDGSILGWNFMLFAIALISLTLAIMNILPIPALDGGRLWLTLGARALRKPLTAKTEEAVNAAGFVIIIVLVILISVVDVRRFL